MEWNREKCLELIDVYEQHPVLWNPKDGQYYNKLKKHDAWSIIHQKFGCSAGESKKIESLLASFRREKGKGNKSMGTGKGRHEIYVTKWFAFQRLEFLLDRDEPRATLDTAESENTELEREVALETGSVLENEGTAVNSQEVFEETATKTQEITTPTPRTVGAAKRKRLEREMDSPKVDEALGILRSAVANSALKTNGCSIYGQHVANKLRCYMKRVQNILEHHINNILFNADMGCYSQDESPYPSSANQSSANQTPLNSPQLLSTITSPSPSPCSFYQMAITPLPNLQTSTVSGNRSTYTNPFETLTTQGTVLEDQDDTTRFHDW